MTTPFCALSASRIAFSTAGSPARVTFFFVKSKITGRCMLKVWLIRPRPITASVRFQMGVGSAPARPARPSPASRPSPTPRGRACAAAPRAELLELEAVELDADHGALLALHHGHRVMCPGGA